MQALKHGTMPCHHAKVGDLQAAHRDAVPGVFLYTDLMLSHGDKVFCWPSFTSLDKN